MEEARKEVIKCVRGCLISSKGKVSLKQLNSDYDYLIGERIPYQKLGFQKLEDFIRSTDELELTKQGNEYLVEAVPDKKSSHIAALVSKQKTKTKPVQRVRFHVPKQRAPRFDHSKQPPSKWRPKHNGTAWKNSPRPRDVSYSHIIDRHVQRVASKVIIPEHSTLNHAGPAKTNMQARLTTQKVTIDKMERNGTGPVDSVPITPSTASLEESVNPLNSTRKRISRMMSELNTMGRDSGNSSPVSDVSPVSPRIKTPEFVPTGDPLADLEAFAEIHNLGPVEISIRDMKLKRNSHMLSCKIKVDKNTYSSYPKEFAKEKEARDYCCELALADLLPKYRRRKSLLVSSEIDVLERIPPMLEKHQNGILSRQLTLDYAEKYNEQLPDVWLDIVSSSPFVEVQAIPDDHILWYCKSGAKGQRRNLGITIFNVSVPPKKLQFDEQGRMMAVITYAPAANEIWCHQINNPNYDKFTEMVTRMEEFYKEREVNVKALSVVEGGYYVVKADSNYFRVRAISVAGGNEINCFSIDYGDETTVLKSDMFELERDFALVEAQAFVCRLAGLEELYEISVNSDALDNLGDAPVFLEVAHDLLDDSSEQVLPVFMYEAETGVSVNENLISKLTMESALPVLDKGIITVYVSYIESNGDIYVQIRNYGFEHFDKIRKDLGADIESNPPKDVPKPITKLHSENKLYFTASKFNGQWHRVKPIDWSPRGDFAKICYVDLGATDVIEVAVAKLYPLDAISDVLSQYPPQAVKVRMALDKIPEDFVDLAAKRLPYDQAVLLKVVDGQKEGVPRVDFFKRNEQGELLCVNKSMAMDIELREQMEESRQKLAQMKMRCLPSAGTLAAPALTEGGKLFGVHVPLAVTPYNFFVQPLASQDRLNDMMEKLQERYRGIKYGNLTAADIVPGQIYASRHEDGFWYRTSVIKVIHASSISVFFCDFGYYRNLVVKELVPLDGQFLELPYQALKAKLSNVKPKENKWTMEGCDTFKALVEKKNLYSMLMKVEKDVLYESDLVLELVLIDTSSDDDVFIDKELVKLGLAVTE